MRKDEFAIVQEIKKMGQYEMLKEIKKDIENLSVIRDPITGEHMPITSSYKMRTATLKVIDDKIKALEAEAEDDAFLKGDS